MTTTQPATRTLPRTDDHISVWAVGLTFCCVSAPIGMQREVVLARANAQQPNYALDGWQIAPEWPDGVANPRPSAFDPGRQCWRLHARRTA